MNSEIAIIATIVILISIPVTFFLLLQAQGTSAVVSKSPFKLPPEPSDCAVHFEVATTHRPPDPADGDVAVSGLNIYTAWSCYNHILFAKSNDGGKTYANTILMSAPDINPKIHVMNENVSISASGNNIAVMWDSNNTGISNPVIRTSSDGGNTFSNMVTLNSTPGGINKPAGSNMTGAAGNSTGGANGSSLHTTNPAAYSTHDSGRSIRNVK